ncbi:MAG TPA: 2-amino-4-hydroxy-6-hydroxymethyldihydropteridine diphosphokinase [Mycobacteriales bacterium]|nr:2-amino-4-hydroxy-6-hydroxymethyldihydropteridine diphosphokinase [Mycobacteriales bacterium]
MKAVLSLGSNMGDRAAHLATARQMIAAEYPVIAVSSIYETVPVGVDDQPSFLNQVVVVEADDADVLLAAAHRAESARGRLRNRRWGPRTLDVDVVTVDAIQSSSPRLTLPHPRAHERAFVLVPWLEVDPDAELPGRGQVAALLRGLDRSVVRRWGR